MLMSKFRDDFRASFREAKANAQQKHRGGFRFWLNVIVFLLIIVVLWAARSELVQAFHLLANVNVLILLTIIPVQFASYYASAEIFFTYLRTRGQLKKSTPLDVTAVALEYNFVNHVFPSAGVSGSSYVVWRLGKLGVPAGQAAMSQLINFFSLGSTFMIMMVISLIWATFEDRAANWLVVATTIAVVALIAVVIFGSYLIGSRERLMNFARWLTRRANWLVSKATFGRKKKVLQTSIVEGFFSDFYDDWQAIQADKALLKGPIIWGFISNILDVVLIAVAFWALGYSVSLPILLISFGASAVGSFLFVTPGGVGAYEAVMIGVLVAGGMEADVASAGVILARAILVVGTIVCGVFAYHAAMKKYGRPVLRSPDEFEQFDGKVNQEHLRSKSGGKKSSASGHRRPADNSASPAHSTHSANNVRTGNTNERRRGRNNGA